MHTNRRRHIALDVSLGLAWFAVLSCASAHAAPIEADVQCKPDKQPLVFDCLIRLRDGGSGQAVTGAEMMMAADMPSMPMVHHVTPVAARASGTPGTYRASIALEMEGVWTLTLKISKPMRVDLRRTLEMLQSP
jgi:hypothetical protein